MRDLTKFGFNSNLPSKNYYKLVERIDELNQRIRDLEMMVIDSIAKKNGA